MDRIMKQEIEVALNLAEQRCKEHARLIEEAKQSFRSRRLI
jgi:hypothetical protein